MEPEDEITEGNFDLNEVLAAIEAAKADIEIEEEKKKASEELPKKEQRKRGRPRGVSQKTKEKREAVAKAKEEMQLKFDRNRFRCAVCQEGWEKQETHFYRSPFSPLFKKNGGYTNICSNCIKNAFSEIERQYKDRRIAAMFCCYITDNFFSEVLYENIKSRSDFNIGALFSSTNNLQQNHGKTFFVNLFDYFTSNGSHRVDDIRGTLEANWNEDDVKNKNKVIKALGYDPVSDDTYSLPERKFMFNIMASYINGDVEEDIHKLQQVVQIGKMFLEIQKIDIRTNEEFRRNIQDPKLLASLVDMKSSIIRSINAIAAENGISDKSGGKKNTASTLSGIMREMEDNDYKEIKVNIADAKLSESYKEVAKANAAALMEELSLTSDEFAAMVAEQSETIRSLNRRIEELEEKNRLLMKDRKSKHNSIIESE